MRNPRANCWSQGCPGADKTTRRWLSSLTADYSWGNASPCSKTENIYAFTLFDGSVTVHTCFSCHYFPYSTRNSSSCATAGKTTCIQLLSKQLLPHPQSPNLQNYRFAPCSSLYFQWQQWTSSSALLLYPGYLSVTPKSHKAEAHGNNLMHEEKKNIERGLTDGRQWAALYQKFCLRGTCSKLFSPEELNLRKSLLNTQLTALSKYYFFYNYSLLCGGWRELNPMAKAAHVSAESFSFPFLICAKCASPHTRFSTHPEVHHVSLGPSNPAVKWSGNTRGTSVRLWRSRLVEVGWLVYFFF